MNKKLDYSKLILIHTIVSLVRSYEYVVFNKIFSSIFMQLFLAARFILTLKSKQSLARRNETVNNIDYQNSRLV